MSLTVTRDRFPLREVFTISRGSKTEAAVLTVELSREGATGRGECVPYARYGESLDSVAAEISALPEVIDRATLQNLLPAGPLRLPVPERAVDRVARRAGRHQPGDGVAVCSGFDRAARRFDGGDHAVDRFAVARIGHALAAPFRVGLRDPDHDDDGLGARAARNGEGARNGKGFADDGQTSRHGDFRRAGPVGASDRVARVG